MHLVYESRSLRSPFFCLALPSLFLPLSPVRAPPASFIRPLALSIAPSSLSSLPLLPPSRPICFLLCTRLPFVAGAQPTQGPPRSVRLHVARPHLEEERHRAPLASFATRGSLSGRSACPLARPAPQWRPPRRPGGP